MKEALLRGKAACGEGERRALEEWEEKIKPSGVIELPEGLLDE